MPTRIRTHIHEMWVLYDDGLTFKYMMVWKVKMTFAELPKQVSVARRRHSKSCQIFGCKDRHWQLHNTYPIFVHCFIFLAIYERIQQLSQRFGNEWKTCEYCSFIHDWMVSFEFECFSQTKNRSKVISFWMNSFRLLYLSCIESREGGVYNRS